MVWLGLQRYLIYYQKNTSRIVFVLLEYYDLCSWAPASRWIITTESQENEQTNIEVDIKTYFQYAFSLHSSRNTIVTFHVKKFEIYDIIFLKFVRNYEIKIQNDRKREILYEHSCYIINYRTLVYNQLRALRVEKICTIKSIS